MGKDYVMIAFKEFNVIMFFSQKRVRKKYLLDVGNNFSFKVLNPDRSQRKYNMPWKKFVNETLIRDLKAEIDSNINSLEDVN